MQNGEFHLEQGLYFQRLEDGSVKIRLTEEPLVDSPTVFELVVDDAGWASVVASVCERSETGDTWQEALDYHNQSSTPQP